MKTPKILIIGIDGATFSLIVPWAKAGKLPNLQRLMENGAWGNLDSTIPPLTSPAWTSFMTGKNPGKHGLFHFISPKRGSYDFIYTNANTRKSSTVWKILSDCEKSVGVVNVPMTFPPEKVNGFMISGMDTPDEGSEFIYPASLRQELENDFGKIMLEIRHLEFMRSDDKRDTVLKDMADLEAHRAGLAVHLIKKYPVDVFMLVFCSIDQIQHYFWHYMDKGHHKYDAREAHKYENAILEAYQTIDDKIGKLLGVVGDDTIIMLMSDHGAGPTSNTIVHINQYLAEIGVLKFKENRDSSAIGGIVKKIDPFLRKTLTPRQKAKIANLFPEVRKKWETNLASLSSIDWGMTKAFCLEVLPTYTNIWINLKEKFPDGIVNCGLEYDELVDTIIEKLRQLKEPETGRNVVKKIYRKKEIYNGPYIDAAPDILLSWWDDDSFTLRPGIHSSGSVVEKLGKGFDNFVNWSGTHRLKGIFLFKGQPFKIGRIPDGVSIVDLAPTILHLMGQPVPDDMDGRVIEGAFKQDYITANPVKYEKTSAGSGDNITPTDAYSTEEAEMVRKRLKALGYMD